METQLALSLGYGPRWQLEVVKCKKYKKHKQKFCVISTILGGAKTKGTLLQEWWSFHLLDSSYNYGRKM